MHTVTRFIHDLETLLRGDSPDARIAAQDIAGDLLILIEHVPWASAELTRRQAEVVQLLLQLRLHTYKHTEPRNYASPPE